MARRLRPLRRRFARTFCPPLVAIRARKPCVQTRRRLWGWYVRFIGVSSSGGREEKHRTAASSRGLGRPGLLHFCAARGTRNGVRWLQGSKRASPPSPIPASIYEDLGASEETNEWHVQ